jgi:branched-chain amino acid transport system permease protein
LYLENVSFRRFLIILGGVGVLLALFPRLGLMFETEILTYGLIFAIAALGFNLLLGYTGLLSFGHAAFFGVGAYTVAFLVRDLGVNTMEIHILAGLLTSALIAALFGIICVRYTFIFFALLALALSQVLWTLAFKFYWITGGTDGIRVPRMLLLGGLIDHTGRGAYFDFVNAYYYYVLVIFLLSIIVMWVIVHSPFGKALQAIRDNETRARFIGINIIKYRWFAFIISGTYTGLAGVLWAPVNRLVQSEILYWPHSGELVFMTLLGGFRNFTGPIFGAIIYNRLHAEIVGLIEYWQFFLGLVLVLLILFLPNGLVGGFTQLVARLRSREPLAMPSIMAALRQRFARLRGRRGA